MRVALLDDYQDVALSLADWGSLPAGSHVEAFRDHLDDEDALAARLAEFDAVVAMRERTPFRRTLLERLPKLKLLITTGAGNASFDLQAAEERGIVVCGTGGRGSPTVELTWGLILAIARQIPAEDRAIAQGHWQTSLGVGLEGKTLGMIGLGNLGSKVATVGLAFGMKVIAWSQNLTVERAAAVGASLVSKEELLATADVISVHLVLSDRTRGLIGAADLALMQRSAFFVNTSRGPIVDEAALADALRSHRIAGAGIDVFDTEPLPADHPYRGLDNIVMTPHLGYVTRETYEVFYGDALADIQAYMAGTPVRVIKPRA